MSRWILILTLAAASVSGCKEEKKPAGGVKIEAPGVKVNIDEKGKANVTAPGVEVKTNP
jgi:hypothetical protein